MRRDLPELVRILAGSRALTRHRHDDQRRAPRRARRRRSGRPACTASPSASTRSTRALPAARPASTTLPGSSPASTPPRAAGFALAQDRHGRHARRQRRRDRGRCSSAGSAWGAEVRFIEYMDVGGATRWSRGARRLAGRDARDARGAATARSRRSPGRTLGAGRALPACRTARVFGIIASTTAPFCRACDRSRLTADGALVPVPLRGPRDRPARAAARRRADAGAARAPRLDAGAAATTAAPRSVWRCASARRCCLGIELERDPHLEMHTRGG